MDDTKKDEPSPADVRRRRLRSIAIAVGLGFMALMFYAATIVRMGGQVAN